jgi:hypothetical protein
MADLFVEPEIRRRTLIVFAMSLATTLAWWGISTFVPPYVAGVAGKSGLPAQQWATYGALVFNFGALFGQIAYGFLADRFGRKPTTLIYFAVAFAMTPPLFLWTNDPALILPLAAANAFFCQGLFSWMPAWLPELFPTHLRDRRGIWLQHAPLHRVSGPPAGGRYDHEIRRIRPGCDPHLIDLHSWLRRCVVTPGDEGKGAAGRALTISARD